MAGGKFLWSSWVNKNPERIYMKPDILFFFWGGGGGVAGVRRIFKKQTGIDRCPFGMTKLRNGL